MPTANDPQPTPAEINARIEALAADIADLHRKADAIREQEIIDRRKSLSELGIEPTF